MKNIEQEGRNGGQTQGLCEGLTQGLGGGCGILGVANFAILGVSNVVLPYHSDNTDNTGSTHWNVFVLCLVYTPTTDCNKFVNNAPHDTLPLDVYDTNVQKQNSNPCQSGASCSLSK